jgi:hypothetical protein
VRSKPRYKIADDIGGHIMLKILSDKYNNVVVWNNRGYLCSGLFKSVDITEKIKIVNLINQERVGNANLWDDFMSVFTKPKVYTQCMITLDNDEQFIIETDDRQIIQFLIPYMHVKKRGAK